MAELSLPLSSVLELTVILFQVFGVVALCLCRLLPPASARWANRGRVGFIVALVGLGFAGALCGRLDSEFALFAGGTMTVLFIGMTIGNGSSDTMETAPGPVAGEPNLAS